MLHPARVTTALVVLVLLLGLHHLTGGLGTTDVSPADTAGAAARHDVPVVQELSRRWSDLPGVLEAHAGYTGADDFGVVLATAVCTRCDRRRLLLKLAGDIWTSDLRRVTSFKVSVAHDQARQHPMSVTWNVQRDARRLYNRYGNGLVDPDRVGGTASR